jgi:hypothetical protein
MSDIRRTLQQLDEMTAGATGGGAIAPAMGGNGFANGGPGTTRRIKETENTGRPSDFGHWANSPQKRSKQKLVKSMHVVESKKKIDEADLEEEKLEPKNKKSKSDVVGKKKPDQRDIGKKPADRGIQPKQLSEGVDEAEALFKRVRNITSGIKHGVDAREIMTQIQMLADEAGIDVNYEIREVYDAMKELESAVYGLDEPFEYAYKQARDRDEEELDESPDGVSPGTHMVCEDDPETERQWCARMKQEHGDVKIVKDKRTGILHAMVKNKKVGTYDGNQRDMFDKDAE